MTFSLEYSVKDTGRSGTPFNFDLDLDINGDTTFREFKERIRLAQILIARSVLREEQRDGFDKSPITRVDGVAGRKEEQVKPFGRIEYFSKISDLEILLQVYKSIEERSPVRTGLYRNSNYVFVDNRIVAKNEAELFKFVEQTKEFGISEISEVRFVNVTPYAARLEYSGTRKEIRGLNKGLNVTKGKTGKSRYKKTLGRPIKKPNGAYYLASRTLGSIKGFFAQVKFEFIPNGFQGLIFDPDGVFRNTYANSPKNRAKRRVGKPYVYPSILFKISR